MLSICLNANDPVLIFLMPPGRTLFISSHKRTPLFRFCWKLKEPSNVFPVTASIHACVATSSSSAMARRSAENATAATRE